MIAQRWEENYAIEKFFWLAKKWPFCSENDQFGKKLQVLAKNGEFFGPKIFKILVRAQDLRNAFVGGAAAAAAAAGAILLTWEYLLYGER